MGAVLAGVRTDLALELLLVSVDGLVLLQGGLLGEQLPAGLAAELLLAVVLLVFLQVVGGLGPEGAVLMLTDEGLVRLVTGLVSQHLLDPAVLVGAPGTFVGRRTSYVARLDMLVVILDPGTLEGTEGTAVLLVLPVNFLVDLQFVRGGAAEGTLAALDAVLQLLWAGLGGVLTAVLRQQFVLPVHDDLLGADGVLRGLGVGVRPGLPLPTHRGPSTVGHHRGL